VHLGDVGALFCSARLARQFEAQGVEALVGEAFLAVAGSRAGEFLGIVALGDPGAAQGW